MKRQSSLFQTLGPLTEAMEAIKQLMADRGIDLSGLV